MQQFIEPLESRTFLSAVPAVTTLKIDGRIVQTDLIALNKVGHSGFKTIQSDLRVAKELKSSSALLRTLSIEGTSAFNTLSRGIAKTKALLAIDINRLIAAALRVKAHPTNTTFTAKFAAAVTALSTDAANRLPTITNDITTQQMTNSANVDAIIAANPGDTRLATDVMTIGQNSSAARTALSDIVTTTLTTDVNAIIAAFSA